MKIPSDFKRIEIMFLLISTLLLPLPFIFGYVFSPEYEFKIVTPNQSSLSLKLNEQEGKGGTKYPLSRDIMLFVHDLPNNVTRIILISLHLKENSIEYDALNDGGYTPEGGGRGITFNLEHSLNWKRVQIRAVFNESFSLVNSTYDTGWKTVGDPFFTDSVFDLIYDIFAVVVGFGYISVIYLIWRRHIEIKIKISKKSN